MRVAVDQAGDGQHARGVYHLAGLADLAAGDDGLDAVASDGDVAIGEHCVSAIVLADEGVAAGDEQVWDGHGRIVG